MFRFVFSLVFCALLARGEAAAQSGCSEIYPPTGGWALDLCTDDPNIPTPMEVVLDDVSQGDAVLVRVYHATDDGSSLPQVAVVASSAFVRLKPNADPVPPIPFGSSFVLGPGYWPDAATYHHNPQLSRLEIDTSGLPGGPLRLRAEGANHDFDVVFEMMLPEPRDRLTRLHVSQTHTAGAAVAIDPTRRAEAQGFKLVQVSSMYINEGQPCASTSDCHDSDGARVIGSGLERSEVSFSDVAVPGFVFASPAPLGGTWLDARHRDDASWQGNTPNVRIALDVLPEDRTITPQGWIAATGDPNDDNVGLWLHDDGQASVAWSLGESDRIDYWLLATDDPPEPWSDLGLRPGSVLLDMESGGEGSGEPCFFTHDPGQGTSGAVAAVAGHTDRALELSYDLGTADGNWAQIRCDFDPPLDLSAFDHLRFDWRGDPAAANSLEVALISRTGGEDRIFGRGYHHPAHRAWWGQMVVPFSFLAPWTPGTTFNPGEVKAFFLSVVKDPVDDDGGAGSVGIDNLSAENVADRNLPAALDDVPPHGAAAAAAADWIAGEQRPGGLIKSWEQEERCISHTYDQALALLVFLHQGPPEGGQTERLWPEADAVVAALVTTQNLDGSWFKSRDCDTLAPIDDNPWEGDIAWAIFALNRYLELGGSAAGAAGARDAAAQWLEARIDSGDGCLVIDHTEGTIDAWWALATAGEIWADAAHGLSGCLLGEYWDPAMGRFKGGRSWRQPFLDNQTWAAPSSTPSAGAGTPAAP